MTAGHEQALEDSVLVLLEEIRARTHERDIDGLLALYAEDNRFHWVEDGRIRYMSVGDAAAGFVGLDSLFESTEIEWIEPRAVALAPGVGAVTTTYRQVFSGADGVRFTLEGAITWTAIHRPDGWKLLMGHTSTPRNR